MFYPDIQNCIHNLQSQSCWLLLREEAAYIYRKSGESDWASEAIHGLGARDGWEEYSFGEMEGSDFETLKGDLVKGGWLGSILLRAIGKVGEIPISIPHIFFESQKLFGPLNFII